MHIAFRTARISLTVIAGVALSVSCNGGGSHDTMGNIVGAAGTDASAGSSAAAAVGTGGQPSTSSGAGTRAPQSMGTGGVLATGGRGGGTSMMPTTGGTNGGSARGGTSANGSGAAGSVGGGAGASGTGTGTSTFTQVYAMFMTNCSGSTCHINASRTGDGLSMADKMTAFMNLVGVNSVSCNGEKRVVAGDPDKSELVHTLDRTRIGSCTRTPQMPDNKPKLAQPNIDLVVNWIMAGAKND